MKSRTVKLRMIISLTLVVIGFTLAFIFLPYLNMTNNSSTSGIKMVNSQIVDKYFGGKWNENDSLSGYVKPQKSYYEIHFYNGSTENVSSENLTIVNPQINKYLGFIEVDLRSINFTTFYSGNQTLSIIILNYTSTMEPKNIYNTIYTTFKDNSKAVALSFHNISNCAFIASIDCYQFSIGYSSSEIIIVFYKGCIDESLAITDLINYML
ncbi:hypothetical protein Ahos_0110 [Acidianus hospitalis W1]|uniref:Uncharacterized protein n=1 Tax=Acidianus hospitalis (strain W1) TaxID=933801 RepID=F4B439_ACIHW|nr:hypothetical protein [Acidianus hospitalis]AEE93003.1 hypothetical protein Ahos_0110 [Acidianus hospitalis W1]